MTKQSVNRDKRTMPDWMSDCTFIDDLKDDQVAYTLSWYPFEIPDKGWFISCDAITSPINRGTHDCEIKRVGDVIWWRSTEMNCYESPDIYKEMDNSFQLVYKPYSLEEKIEILWEERKHR